MLTIEVRYGAFNPLVKQNEDATPKPEPWLTDFYVQERNGLYIVGASSPNKRISSHMTGSSGGGGKAPAVCLDLFRQERPDLTLSAHLTIRLPGIAPGDYSSYLWDYRYGPTIVLAPVFDVLAHGASVEFEVTHA